MAMSTVHAQALELAAKRPGASATPPSQRDFGYLAEVAFGEWGKRIIAITTAMELWLAVVTFLVMSGINAQGLLGMDEPHAVAFCTAITALLVFIPLRVYAYVSLASLVALCVASTAYLIDLFQMNEWNWPLFSAPLGVGDVFRAYGLIIFCFAGHPCFPALHQSMSDRTKWEPCVTFSFLVAAGYYVCLGLLAFLALGTNMHAVFTADMSGSGVLRRVTIAAFAVKIQLTAPVLLRVVLTCLRVWPEGVEEELPLTSFVPTALIVVFTGFSACVLASHLAALASLCGAFLVNLTSVILPILIYMKLESLVPSARTTAFKVKLGLCWAAAALGAVAGLAGTAMAVRDLLHRPVSLGVGS
ncbi:AVT1J [Symbiodinium natans]|uniref:AVT1J protein n=1 Tax=Symbiodinium natans TaxID=878477 RepID=A0A812R7H3_9DINO|nr:AVT1J [Symbiodinium natans]